MMLSAMIDQAELRRREYVGRINRVMDYISEHLKGDLHLETLARVASFSPFHFHRVFKAIVGETLNEFTRRMRAQRAASHLICHPKMTIGEIAVECGYASLSTFAREFRRAYGMSASQFRSGGASSLHEVRRALQARDGEMSKLVPRQRAPFKFSVEVQRLTELYVAYVRHLGPYNRIGLAIQRLMKWAGPRGLLRLPQTQVLAIYHDSPEVTPERKLRADACITIPEGTTAEADVGTQTIPGGLFAVAQAEIDVAQYPEAWDKLLGEWLPQSGYQADDRLCYELYLNDPEQHPQKKHIIQICEPIRPL